MRRYSRITVKRKPVAGYTAIPPSASGGGLTDQWAKNAASAIGALVPGITRYQYLPTPAAAVASPGVSVNVLGGGVGVASDTTYLPFGFATTYANPQTDLWGVVFRAKFPAIATSKISFLGLGFLNGTNANAVFGWNQATSATKWIIGSTVSTFAADALEHDFMFTGDGTNGILTIDGTQVLSVLSSTFVASACLPVSFSSATITPGVVVQRLVYGFVDPQ